MPDTDIPKRPQPKRAAPNAPSGSQGDGNNTKQVLADSAPHGAAAIAPDPSPPPDHRYRTAARAAFDGRLLSRRGHDRLTCRLADYLAARSECHDQAELMEVDRRFEDLALVMKAHSGADREKGILVEAYTLTGMRAHDISPRVHLSPEIIQLYQLCFCSYKRLVENRAHVLRQARIEQALKSRDAMRERKGVLLLLGCCCGWQQLDSLVWTRRPLHEAGAWTGRGETFDQLRQFELMRSVAVAAFTRSAPPRTARDLAALANELTRLGS